jgi:kynurenine formamidase
MILPLVVIDVHAESAKNSDYTLSLERVKKWEVDHGPIPVGAFVAMRTNWSKRWPDGAAMDNKDSSLCGPLSWMDATRAQISL